MTLCDRGEGILNCVTSHFRNSIKAILHVARCLSFYLSLTYLILFYFLNVLFIFIPMFDLMFTLMKNHLNGNKNNFGTAVLI